MFAYKDFNEKGERSDTQLNGNAAGIEIIQKLDQYFRFIFYHDEIRTSSTVYCLFAEESI